MKCQRKTNGLGINNTRNREISYIEIEKSHRFVECRRKNHVGERTLPIRSFYLNEGGKKLQNECIECQKRNRSARIKRCRGKFQGKTGEEVCDMYISEYGPEKKCSKRKTDHPPTHFPLSFSMETGLHNHCYECSCDSQGNGGIRDFIFMPDKDNIHYKKDDKCKICSSTKFLSVDHIIPISKGGTDCISNKQTLCRKCNSSKSNKLITPISMDLICERYRDSSLDFSNLDDLSDKLSRKVVEFRDGIMKDLKYHVREYLINNNLGADLNKTVNNILLL